MNFFSEIRKSISLKAHQVEGENKVVGWFSLLPLTLLFCFWFILMGSNNIKVGAGDGTLTVFQYLFHISKSQIALFASLFLLGNVTMLFPIGILLDRFSIKKIILISSFIGLCILLMFNFITTPVIAMICAYFIGFFVGSIVFIPGVRLVFQWFDAKNAALPIAVNVAIGTFGSVLIGLIGPHLVNAFGPKSITWGLVICLGVIWLLVWTIREKDVPYKRNLSPFKKELIQVKKSLFEIFKIKENWLVPVIIAFLNLPVAIFAWSIGSTWLPEFFNKIDEFKGINSNVDTNLTLTIMMVGIILGTIFFGQLSDYFGKRKLLLVIGTFITICATLSLFIGNALGYVGVCIVFFIIGFFAASQSIGYAIIGENNKDQNKGVANSLNSFILLGLGAISENVFAAFANTSLAQTSEWITLLMIPIAMMIALIFVVIIKETGQGRTKKISS